MARTRSRFKLDDEDVQTLQHARYMSVRRAFATDADLARALDVDQSRISRWKQGATVSEGNREKLVALDMTVDLLSDFLEPESIPKWLQGFNAHLGGARPIDVLRQGRFSEVINAIQAEKTGSYA